MKLSRVSPMPPSISLACSVQACRRAGVQACCDKRSLTQGVSTTVRFSTDACGQIVSCWQRGLDLFLRVG